jgi:hypothetical protein
MLVNPEKKLGILPCSIPTVENLHSGANVEKILGSHEWIADRIEPQGSEQDAILLKVHCKNCGLERISIISDIQDSAKKAEEYRASLN